MELAREFKFKHEHNADTLYSAHRGGDGSQYEVRWTDDGDEHQMSYPTENVRRFIEDGVWLIREVITPAYTPVPDTFTVRTAGGSILKAVRQPDQTFHIFNEYGLRIGDVFRYTDDDYRNFTASGAWTVVELDEPTIVHYDEDEPFNGQEAEFIYVDEADQLPLTLAEIQHFVREFADDGWLMEICPDYFTLTQPDAGDAKMVARDEAELRELLTAIKTVRKYLDRG